VDEVGILICLFILFIPLTRRFVKMLTPERPFRHKCDFGTHGRRNLFNEVISKEAPRTRSSRTS